MTRNFNDSYRCDGCGLTGHKLWREYQTLACYTELVCASCASASQAKSPHSSWSGEMLFVDGDQIGWRVPAVTTEDGDTFWGYSSVPADRIAWWYAMPTYQDQTKNAECERNIKRRKKQWDDFMASYARKQP